MSKRVLEYGPEVLGLRNIDGQTEAETDGNILRWNAPHAAALYFDVDCTDDDGNAGTMDIGFDVYSDDGATIIWSGDLATDIPIDADLKGCILFGGGVSSEASDGSLNGDAPALAIFNRIRFRLDVTAANNDGTGCTINVRAVVQE